MDYYKSTVNGHERVCTANKTNGVISVITNYGSLGFYNFMNQQFSTDKNGHPYSEYDMYLLEFQYKTKSEFTTYVDSIKSFLNSL
jgi:hypothetical protein